VNSDQMQVIYQQSSALTYERKGSRQVSTIGPDEKQAFTLNVAISASGVLLPFQVIFKGKTKASLPAPGSPSHDEANQLGFLFEFSGSDNYWANEVVISIQSQPLLQAPGTPKLTRSPNSLPSPSPCRLPRGYPTSGSNTTFSPTLEHSGSDLNLDTFQTSTQHVCSQLQTSTPESHLHLCLWNLRS
ncbi:uncharacterized protein EI90DRAFT_2920527, partial [Cantharellus anzutake]|uniref:uncharacterized protein n=1 Tax=Cantharellus anzutake TaxID=1750568 RepID=UPI001907E4AB